jgi:hypothetical protein
MHSRSSKRGSGEGAELHICEGCFSANSSELELHEDAGDAALSSLELEKSGECSGESNSAVSSSKDFFRCAGDGALSRVKASKGDEESWRGIVALAFSSHSRW